MGIITKKIVELSKLFMVDRTSPPEPQQYQQTDRGASIETLAVQQTETM